VRKKQGFNPKLGDWLCQFHMPLVKVSR
jgi:hypothetical protein